MADALYPLSSKAKRSLVHFFHTDFRRCKIMDKHLEVGHVERSAPSAELNLAPTETSGEAL